MNNTPTASLVKFTAGRSYSCRSACDQDAVWTFVIVSRTVKRLTIREEGKTGTKVVGVSEYDGLEVCYPLGRYSMAPSLRA